MTIKTSKKINTINRTSAKAHQPTAVLCCKNDSGTFSALDFGSQENMMRELGHRRMVFIRSGDDVEVERLAVIDVGVEVKSMKEAAKAVSKRGLTARSVSNFSGCN